MTHKLIFIGVIALLLSSTLVVVAQNPVPFLGNGDGTFRRHVDYPAPDSGQIWVADFNQDRKLDLVVTGNSLDILLGTHG